MIAMERESFEGALNKLMGLFNRSLDSEQRAIWWAALKPYELDTVRAAMLRYSQDRQHAPVPASVRAMCGDIKKPAQPVSQEATHWTGADLLCACNMAAIDWANAKYAGRQLTGPVDWADRVAKAYDADLAETCLRVVAKRKAMTPADAARDHLREHPVWTQPRKAAPLEQAREAA